MGDSIQRGDIVKFRTLGANPADHTGEVIHFIPRGSNVYGSSLFVDSKLLMIPKKRRRFAETNTKNDRYLVAVHRKGVQGNLINSIDYYAPIAERVEKA